MNERALTLIPAEPHKGRFAEILRELAARLDAPVSDAPVRFAAIAKSNFRINGFQW